jgi:hypothetical protein
MIAREIMDAIEQRRADAAANSGDEQRAAAPINDALSGPYGVLIQKLRQFIESLDAKIDVARHTVDRAESYVERARAGVERARAAADKARRCLAEASAAAAELERANEKSVHPAGHCPAAGGAGRTSSIRYFASSR